MEPATAPVISDSMGLPVLLTGEAPTVHLRIKVPELDFEDVFVFCVDELVWTVKQKMLSSINKELPDALNYGVYCPPSNERAGKFLDEERPLKDYPMPGPIACLEFKSKRRTYKGSDANSSKLKKVNSQANMKAFLDCVRRSETDKMAKLTSKGLDPNFIERGETPLTVAATLVRPRIVMMALLSAGAYLDLRNAEGMTPLHIAAVTGNKEALRTLLDLGSSPNYKDCKGLTPLFHCMLNDTNEQCVQMLLHERAEIGARDSNEWTEVHHACVNGRVQHLEHLLFYGADLNAVSSTSDTPLHVCAKHNKVDCARMLLFRGADTTIRNVAQHTAAELASLSANTEMADLIKNPTEVVLFTELPKYNEKRRGSISMATIRNLQRSRSNPQLELLFSGNNNWTSSLSCATARHLVTGGYLHGGAHAGGAGGRYGTSRADSSSARPTSMQVFAGVVPLHNDATSRRQNNSQSLFADKRWEQKVIRIERGGNGSFGLQLRERPAPSSMPMMTSFNPTPESPARQFIDLVDVDSPSSRAGLLAGDYILEINGEDTVYATHQHSVNLLKNSSSNLMLKICRLATPRPDTRGGSLAETRRSQASVGGLEALELLDNMLANELPNTPQTRRNPASTSQPGYAAASISHSFVNPPPYTREPESGYSTFDSRHNQNHSYSSDTGVNLSNSTGGCSASAIPLPPSEFQDEPVPDYDEYVNVGHLNRASTAESNQRSEHQAGRNNPSEFDQSIRQAAMEREIRRSRDAELQTTSQRNAPAQPAIISAPPQKISTPPAQKIPIPPPPPPVPPLPGSNQPQSTRSSHPAHGNGGQNIPETIQKQLHGTRRQDDSHAALMAAVLKRRMAMEPSDGEESSEVTDSRANRPRVVQMGYGAGAPARREPRAPVQPVPLAMLGSVNKPTSPRCQAEDVHSSVNGSSEAEKSNSSEASNSFMLEAERARQEYIQRKTSTLQKNPNPSATPDMPAAYNQPADNAAKVKKPAPVPVMPKSLPPSLPVTGATSNGKPGIGYSNAYTEKFPSSGHSVNNNRPMMSGGYNSPSGAATSPSFASLPPTNNYSPYQQSGNRREYLAHSAGQNKPVFNSLDVVRPAPSANLPQQSTAIEPPSRYLRFNGKPEMPIRNGSQLTASMPVIPPPVEFASEPDEQHGSSNLRSVAPRLQSNSMVFKARNSSPGDGFSVTSASSKSFQEKPIQSWTVADVGDWLESLYYEEYKAMFSEREINGGMLAHVGNGNGNELTSYGVQNLLHKIRLEREIRKEIAKKF